MRHFVWHYMRAASPTHSPSHRINNAGIEIETNFKPFGKKYAARQTALAALLLSFDSLYPVLSLCLCPSVCLAFSLKNRLSLSLAFSLTRSLTLVFSLSRHPNLRAMDPANRAKLVSFSYVCSYDCSKHKKNKNASGDRCC